MAHVMTNLHTYSQQMHARLQLAGLKVPRVEDTDQLYQEVMRSRQAGFARAALYREGSRTLQHAGETPHQQGASGATALAAKATHYFQTDRQLTLNSPDQQQHHGPAPQPGPAGDFRARPHSHHGHTTELTTRDNRTQLQLTDARAAAGRDLSSGVESQRCAHHQTALQPGSDRGCEQAQAETSMQQRPPRDKLQQNADMPPPRTTTKNPGSELNMLHADGGDLRDNWNTPTAEVTETPRTHLGCASHHAIIPLGSDLRNSQEQVNLSEQRRPPTSQKPAGTDMLLQRTASKNLATDMQQHYGCDDRHSNTSISHTDELAKLRAKLKLLQDRMGFSLGSDSEPDTAQATGQVQIPVPLEHPRNGLILGSGPAAEKVQKQHTSGMPPHLSVWDYDEDENAPPAKAFEKASVCNMYCRMRSQYILVG